MTHTLIIQPRNIMAGIWQSELDSTFVGKQFVFVK